VCRVAAASRVPLDDVLCAQRRGHGASPASSPTPDAPSAIGRRRIHPPILSVYRATACTAADQRRDGQPAAGARRMRCRSLPIDECSRS